MNHDAEEFVRFVAESSTPGAISLQEVDPEISQLRERITSGE